MMGNPWRDGLYYSKKSPFMVIEVRGNSCYDRNLVELDYIDVESKGINKIWTFGKYRETAKDIEEITGAKYYNLEIFILNGNNKAYGVIAEDGKSVTICGAMGASEWIWMSLESQRELLCGRKLEDSLIPQNASAQPKDQGKVLWISGPPGAGKSTTAQYLARKKGWIYYEADCFFSSTDPFIPLDVLEPTLEQMKQKPVKVRFIECFSSFYIVNF